MNNILRQTAIYYRIHTEWRENLEEVVSPFFEGFTIIQGTGHWKGYSEPAAIIEIIGWENDSTKVYKLARTIATLNGQESVYVTATPTTFLDVQMKADA